MKKFLMKYGVVIFAALMLATAIYALMTSTGH